MLNEIKNLPIQSYNNVLKINSSKEKKDYCNKDRETEWFANSLPN